jgi:hypothetical protein
MRIADFDKRRRQGASHIPARILIQNGAMRYTINRPEKSPGYVKEKGEKDL